MMMRPNGSLTRQGRLVRTFVGALVLVAALVLAPRAFAESPADGSDLEYDTYTVSAGETLWQIAGDVTPNGGSVRDTVADIMELNGMTSASIDAGQQIRVPLG